MVDLGFVAAAIAEAAGAVLVADHGEDREAVHAERVAIRQLRATLRLTRPLLRRRVTGQLDDDLAALGRRIGAVRDLDVLARLVVEEATDIGAALRRELDVGRWTFELETARVRAVGALRTARAGAEHEGLRHQLQCWAETPPVRRSARDDQVEDVLRARYRTERRALRIRLASVGDDTTDEELHALRRRAKRVRDQAELMAPLRRRAEAERVVLAELSVALGRHRDRVALVGWLEARPSVDPRVELTRGLLLGAEVERLAQLRDAARAAIRTAASTL